MHRNTCSQNQILTSNLRVIQGHRIGLCCIIYLLRCDFKLKEKPQSLIPTWKYGVPFMLDVLLAGPCTNKWRKHNYFLYYMPPSPLCHLEVSYAWRSQLNNRSDQLYKIKVLTWIIIYCFLFVSDRKCKEYRVFVTLSWWA